MKKNFVKFIFVFAIGFMFINDFVVAAPCPHGSPGYYPGKNDCDDNSSGGGTGSSKNNKCDECTKNNPANTAAACSSVCHSASDGKDSNYCKANPCLGSAADFNNPCCPQNAAGTSPDSDASGSLTSPPSSSDDNSGKVDTGKITTWAKDHGYGENVDSIGDPCNLIDGNLQKILSSLFWIISVSAIVLLVVMTSISFIKAIVGSDDEKLKDAFRHLITRIIVVIILLLLPLLLNFIITLINDNFDGEIKIGNDGNVFCDVTKSSDNTVGE